MVYNSSLIGSAQATDAASPPDDALIPPCMHAFPPDQPTGDDGGSAIELPPIVAAFSTIDIGANGAPDAAIPAFGYDLDKTCTCPGLASCQPRKGAAPTENCDDTNGRDHESIVLFQLLRAQANTGTTQIDQGLMNGQYGLLIRISNWNGTSNDPNVTVDFFVSNGLERDDAGAIPIPKMDGTDRWTIDPSSLQNGAQPAFSDPEAYVTSVSGSAVFVANFPMAIPIVFGDRSYLGGATMLLLDAVITGTLQATPITTTLADGGSGVGDGYGITAGTIAGRWPTNQILSTLATIPLEGGFLCGTDPNAYNVLSYRVFRSVICEAADIQQLPNLDNHSPLAPCDAISVGMQFTAVPALLGNTLMVPPAPAGCGDGGVSWSDQCPP